MEIFSLAIRKILIVCALGAFSPQCFSTQSVSQVLGWVALTPKLDLPAVGSVINYDNLSKLQPWVVPGLFEELSFPGIELVIQETQKFTPDKSYLSASTLHMGQAFLDSDGYLRNYSAGRPFSDEQINDADSVQAGYMIGWNWNHRWQHYGLETRKMPLVYLGNKQENAPLSKKLGLLGGGSIDRFLVFDYRKVYLNHLSMLPSQGYKIKMRDSETLFFKEFYEFLSPHNVAGTMFLIERKIDQHADDQVNIYSPTERRVRRYSARERADPVMGSNATLDDVESFSGRVLDYKWKYLGEREILAVSNSVNDTPLAPNTAQRLGSAGRGAAGRTQGRLPCGLSMDGCIFEGQIPVRVKHNDLDERQAQLTLRITQEVRKPGSRCDIHSWGWRLG